jgi:17beta-estradiol 17-dehydrogenase / very-long-chain 3-oxoacyl-CoA reductase
LGRNKQKLDEVEAKVKEGAKNVKTLIVQADLGEELTPNFYQNIYKQIQKLDISIIVNNAGYGRFYPFAVTPADEHMSNVRLNCGAPAMLTHALLPQLLKRGNRSAVINVSSIGQNSPIGFAGAYIATKRFLTFFSYSLSDVYKNKIDVQDLTPGYVTTKLTNYIKSSDAISPERCVKSSLRDLGQAISSIPVPAHSFVALIMRLTYNFAKPLWEEILCKQVETSALRSYMNDNEELKKKKKDD